MNWDQITGKWSQLKGEIRRKWGKLTDDDLEVIAGSKDKLVGRIQERYGIAKEQAQTQLDEWCKTVRLPSAGSRERTVGCGKEQPGHGEGMLLNPVEFEKGGLKMAGKNTAVFGIYPAMRVVEFAVQALKDAGFRYTDISVLYPANVGNKDFAHEKATKAPEGAATGRQLQVRWWAVFWDGWQASAHWPFPVWGLLSPPAPS